MDKYIKYIKDKGLDYLVSELKHNKQLTIEQQGILLMRIMEIKGYTRHKEVAEMLDVSRSYVSLRISKIKDLYPETKENQRIGRPRHEVLELDDLLGNDIPLRLTIKVGQLPKKQLIALLEEAKSRLEKIDDNFYSSPLDQ